jgi:hypothetical protein
VKTSDFLVFEIFEIRAIFSKISFLCVKIIFFK